MANRSTRDDTLPTTLATWVYQLHAAGVDASDPAFAAACKSVADAPGPEVGNAAAEKLVALARDRAAGGEPPQVLEFARSLFPSTREDFGRGDREDRAHQIRKYQFGRALPWLARIWERQPDGGVRPSWLIIERVTDEVSAMDPNPWNEIEEQRRIPLEDFMVLWELDDCPSVYVS
jgi:hypothetical protein